jgi:hypothetical protein
LTSFVSAVGVAGEAIRAFNRVLEHSLNELAAKVATRGEHHEQYTSQH